MTSIARRGLRAAFAAALGALSLGVAAEAAEQTLRINVGLPPTHTWVKAYTFLEAELPKASNDTLRTQAFYGTLLNLKETATGIRDGVVDIGQVVLGYHPAEFRETNLVGELAMLGKSGVAMTGAVSEYIFTCEPCLQEFARFNQVYLGTAVAPVYVLFTTRPVKTVEDVKGLKIRTGASAYSRWAEHFGASPSSLSANEVYEGLSQGVIDANLHPQTELINLSLYEVAKYVTDLRLGTYNAVSVYSMNRDVWNDLTDDQRAAILDVTARGIAHVAMAYDAANSEARDKAIAKGVTFVEPDPALVAASEAFVAEDSRKVGELMASNYGVKDAVAKVDRFTALVGKWNEMTHLGQVDEAKLAELLKSEVWSQTAPASYAR